MEVIKKDISDNNEAIQNTQEEITSLVEKKRLENDMTLVEENMKVYQDLMKVIPPRLTKKKMTVKLHLLFNLARENVGFSERKTEGYNADHRNSLDEKIKFQF